MKLSEKIVTLRRSRGMTQEDLAEKLNISRQSISRWEMGSAMPDASNILQLSKLFQVSADYLLHEDYQSDDDLPKLKETDGNYGKQILFYMIMLEIMILLIQFMTTVILKNIFFAVLTFLLFAALIGGFEYAYRKKGNAISAVFRKRFYQISAFLGLYFPIRLLLTAFTELLPNLFEGVVFEIVTVVIYLMCALLAALGMEERLK